MPELDGPLARQLGRMVAQAIENKSPEAPAAQVARARATTEIMRLPPDVRRVVATFLSNEVPSFFAIKATNEPLDQLEPENAEYSVGASFKNVESVRCVDPTLGDLLATGAAAQRISAYALASNPLLSFLSNESRTDVDLTDAEHYLERRFLAEVFLPVLSENALTILHAQVPFQEADGTRRLIDFVLTGKRRYAIELEGLAYHGEGRIGRRAFADEKRRQRELQLAGYTYLPFSFDEVDAGTAVSTFRQICEDDLLLRSYLRLEGSPLDSGRTSAFSTAVFLFREFPAIFRDTQYWLLSLMVDAIEKHRDIVITDGSFTYGLVGLAATDLWTLASNCRDLYGLKMSLPQIRIQTVVSATDQRPAMAISSYYDSKDFFSTTQDNRLDRQASELVSHSLISLNESNALTVTTGAITLDNAEHASDTVAASHILTIDTITMASVDARQALLSGPTSEPYVVMQSGLDAIDFERTLPSKRVIDYFGRRYFNVAALYRPQYETVLRTLNGDSSFVLLATAGGKSLCYQLTSLLLPGLTVVVSPLKALIRDQLSALGSTGISAVGGTTSDDTSDERSTLLRDLATGRYRLIYVSPERLLIKSFLDEFGENAHIWNIRVVAVDEAHCVSEWGHDFRPAYLAITRFLDRVAAAIGKRPTLLALTATASPPVLDDVVEALDIPRNGIVTYGSVDRSELSLSVHPVEDFDGTAGPTRSEVLTEVLSETVNRALGWRQNGILERGPNNLPAHSALVFAIYANPHGRHTTPLGVADIAATLREAEVVTASDVRIHASGAVTVCPKCSSHRYWAIKDEAVCDGGHRFDPSDAVPLYDDWPAATRRHQDEFKDGQFPVLVATKGYGMGIDKRNIRVVIHSAYSSGIESYYQEIGRAGRDRQHSHAALVFHPPTEPCLEDLYTAERGVAEGEPACVTPGNFAFWKCPHGLKTPCDYGLQARFIQSSYPGVEKDVDAACQFYSRLLHRAVAGTTRLGPYRDQALQKHQISLYRLGQLGLIDDYYLEYQGLERAFISVRLASPPNAIEIRETLSHALEKLGRPAHATPAGSTSASTNETADAVESLVRPALTELVGATYLQVKGMRYAMLQNLLKYSMGSPSAQTESLPGDVRCRRTILRAPFNQETLTQDYSCEFCDLCVPDLRFKRDRAVVKGPDFGLAEVAQRLPLTLDAFHSDEIDQIVAAVTEHNALATLQARAEHRLESDPANVSARVLAGKAAKGRASRTVGPRRDTLEREALAHLVPAFFEAERRSFVESEVIGIYLEIAGIDKITAVDSADLAGGAMDTRGGRALLLHDAEALNDPDREAVLRRHVALDGLTQLRDATPINFRTRLRSL